MPKNWYYGFCLCIQFIKLHDYFKFFYPGGERISHCVQMWWYYLQGLQSDLWNSLPPKIAANMFGKVFDHTYGILVGRYSKVIRVFWHCITRCWNDVMNWFICILNVTLFFVISIAGYSLNKALDTISWRCDNDVADC